ncbi:TetR family transcriptional regulator [Actinoplanes sp. NPDC089786]|uniref:TetR/AcrR family transcriptional regulator n=1 Tax=Actinoplanes sp. NPDC089786 TaxID=3155185 RepID=UPI00342AC132
MAALDAETILLATEDVLRRFGPAKATVVDVARALGVSHAAVYRHFPSKAALREAVTRRWVGRMYAGLEAIAQSSAPREQRLRDWLVALFHAKRDAAIGEPELFATYRVLVQENSAVAGEHVEALLAQLAGITGDAASARAIFEATASFHHPAHVGEWDRPDRDELLDSVCTLIVDGVRPGR